MRGRIYGLMAVVAGLALPVLGQSAGQVRGRTTNVEMATRAPRLPYTAEYKTTSVKTLADGTTISHESTEVRSVDSQGRQMTALTSVMRETQKTVVTVFDPVARTNSNWTLPGERANVTAMPTNSAAVRTTCPAAPGEVFERPSQQGQQHLAKPTTENLGTETISGVEAHGRRITTTTPAGAIGNDAPLVRTVELWNAVEPGLGGLLVREVTIYPQTGNRTRELTSFTQAEPDPSVFQPPSGYEIVNRAATEIGCSSLRPVEPPSPPPAQ